MYCLDANVWVYFLDADTEEYEAVVDAVSDVIANEPLFTTTVLQMEVTHYLTNQLSEPTASVDRILSLEGTAVADLTAADVERAAELLEEYAQTGIGGRDATVVAAMDRFDVERLWTHDEGLKRLGEQVDWLQVSDPVE